MTVEIKAVVCGRELNMILTGFCDTLNEEGLEVSLLGGKDAKNKMKIRVRAMLNKSIFYVHSLFY